MQATKFASEGGIILCGHIPILTRWKDYKTDNEKHLKNYISKLTRQGRYWLKKKLFNDLPANVVPTKSPMTTLNDDQWNNMREKHAEGDPTPIDLFKNFHCSKNGYTTSV
uniref:Uncharacterized protein n=1 Tax=Setaria viridis TaxID=4556 RepID=A0A4U6VD31_SETVI|nr:hypothetical protein SEVIR_4G152000v2 [Setaria viridis]